MKLKKAAKPLAWIVGAIVILVALFFILQVLQPSSLKVYFLRGEKLMAVNRSLPEGADPLLVAAHELTRGPNKAERAEGLFSEIPAKAHIIKIEKRDQVAVVSFNKELKKYGGGSARVQGLIAQIVYTFTEIPGVEKVQILIENEPEVILGGEGFLIDKPLSREEVRF
jgi:spore germination protein GerM